MLLEHFPDEDFFYKKIEEKYNVIPLCARILADSETPVSMLRRFYNKQSPIFLFESLEGGERWARYSFLGTNFRSEIKVYSDRIEKTGPGAKEIIRHNGDFKPALSEIIKRYKMAEIEDLPPFPGGLTGYLSYEAANCFDDELEKIPATELLASFLIPDTLLVFDNQNHSLTCICLAFIEDDLSVKNLYSITRARLKALLESTKKALPQEKIPEKKDYLLKSMDKAEVFYKRVEKIKEHIREGDILQAVLSQSFTCSAPEDPLALYRAIRYTNPSPYLFFLKVGQKTLIGSSPETMVRLENGLATLRPIAGTRKRGKTPAEDRLLADELLKDEKEKAEHLMLVDLARNDLASVCKPGSLQLTELMVVEKYSHVMHLVSNINAHLEDSKDALDLMAASFPAGTLSGAPRKNAIRIIRENEGRDRGVYGGCVGYLAFNGNMDLAITIRTALIEKERLYVGAGAGIVADSDPEKEWEEIVNKAKAIQTALFMLEDKKDQLL